MKELVQHCMEEWFRFGKTLSKNEPERRSAVGRLYYTVLTYGRVRFGMPLDDGEDAHKRLPALIESMAKNKGASNHSVQVLECFRLLKKIRERSDYRFNAGVFPQDHHDAIELTERIIRELHHPRWDAIERTDNPAEDFADRFVSHVERLHRRFARAAQNFEDALKVWDNDTQSYEMLRALYSGVKQPYFQFWYATLDFMQSDAVEPAAARRARKVLRAASDVYFSVREAYLVHARDYHGVEMLEPADAEQVDLFDV